jgi:hypothetical protein
MKCTHEKERDAKMERPNERSALQLGKITRQALSKKITRSNSVQSMQNHALRQALSTKKIPCACVASSPINKKIPRREKIQRLHAFKPWPPTMDRSALATRVMKRLLYETYRQPYLTRTNMEEYP